MLLAAPAAALAQAMPPQPPPPAAPQSTDRIVEFSADQVTYDNNADVVTATGDVRMAREGN